MSMEARIYGMALVTLIVSMCLTTPLRAMTLAEKSKTEYCITIASDASAPEKRAAYELQGYLKQVTGADFAVKTESQAKASAPRILVGQSKQVKRLLPDVDWAALGHDGIIIRTVGNNLVLAGGQPRGTLYAVYSFLEDTVGVRWWTSTESYVPTRKTLSIPALNTVYAPKLLYREAYYDETNRNGVFSARLKVNGHFQAIPQEYGGHYSVLGWCHTSYMLLPPDKYFAQHPDWYSEIGGKRTAAGAQLCFTSDEMRKELTRVALEWISKNPTAGIISISQNDWGGNYQCAKCKAADQEEGSPSGSLIRFVNAVAEDIEKEYPDMLVETLAYQYTRKPPLHIKPRKNVVIRLCSIECNFLRPLGSDYNAGFRDDMRKWSAIAPNLYVWNYVTDFASFIQPHPNMRALAPDVRFFVTNNTIGIFEQADPGCTIGDFDRMREWLLAHVMWDPSRDERKLMTEYLNGYYGSAGPYLQRYIDLIHDSAEKTGMHLSCYNGDLSFLTLPVMNEAVRLFAEAEKAVAYDPVLAARARRERLVLDHVWLIRYDDLKQQATGNVPFGGPENPAQLCKEFIGLAHEWKNRNASEGSLFDSYMPGLEATFQPVPAPEELSRLPVADRVEIQEDQFHLYGVPDWAQIVKEPSASNGAAARMPGNTSQWAVQYSIPDSLVKSWGGRWRCYVVLRAECGANGCAFQYGIFDNRGAHVAMIGRNLGKGSDGKYHTYSLGTHKLTSTMYLWIAPTGDSNSPKSIYVDRFVMVRDK